jgi:hypothetical protein
MVLSEYLNRLQEVASKLGLELPVQWQGVDAVMPLIDRIRNDGSVFIIKFDGQRTHEDDTGQITVLVSGESLGDDPIRVDSVTLEGGLSFALVKYAERVWF